MWMAALFRGGTPRSLPILSFTRRCVHAERVPRHRVTGAPLRLHASLPQKSRFRLLIASRDLVWTLYRRNRVDFHAKFTLPLSSLCSFFFFFFFSARDKSMKNQRIFLLILLLREIIFFFLERIFGIFFFHFWIIRRYFNKFVFLWWD